MKSVHALWVDGVPGDHHDHGKVGVDQRQRAVLQLASQDALTFTFQFDDCRDVSFYNVIVRNPDSGCEHVLGDCAPVQVCQLLDFQRPLKTSGVAVPAAKHLKIITQTTTALSVHFRWFLTRVPWQAKTSADISDWPEMTPQSMLMPELKRNIETFSSWASTVFMFPGRSWRPPIISDLIQIFGEYISTH